MVNVPLNLWVISMNLTGILCFASGFKKIELKPRDIKRVGLGFSIVPCNPSLLS